MRAFITGATGFLGSHLMELLVREGAAVAILLRPGGNPWRIRELLSRVEIIEGDLAAEKSWEADLARFTPDTVFHLGWHGVGNRHRNDEEQWERNVHGSVALARLAKRLGCRALVGLGSQAEYGPHEGAVSETAATAPTTLYGAAKLAAFHLCRVTLQASKVRFAWLRLFSCYGPKDNPEWLLPSLISALFQRKRPALTAGRQLWDYLYVTDAVRAMACVGACDRAEGAFNLGSGTAFPLRWIVETVRDMIDPFLPLGFDEVPYRPDQVMHLEADISRLRQLTGWKPQVALTDGLANTVRWLAATRRPEGVAA
jgi:nucleoside-diphosphate-sugar epimerase